MAELADSECCRSAEKRASSKKIDFVCVCWVCIDGGDACCRSNTAMMKSSSRSRNMVSNTKRNRMQSMYRRRLKSEFSFDMFEWKENKQN